MKIPLSRLKNLDPELEMQERTGPIFDLFMFLFMMLFIGIMAVLRVLRAFARVIPFLLSCFPNKKSTPSSP